MKASEILVIAYAVKQCERRRHRQFYGDFSPAEFQIPDALKISTIGL